MQWCCEGAILNDIFLNQRGSALTEESDGGPGWLRYASVHAFLINCRLKPDLIR